MNHVYEMRMIRSLSKLLLVLAVAAVLLLGGSAACSENILHGKDLLYETYQRNMTKLEANSFGLPLFLESSEQGDKVLVDVYGIFDYSFNSMVSVLKEPATWCDIVSLHPNVKACTSRNLPSEGLLTFYIGRKVYQTPEETRQVVYQYRKVDQQPGYLDVLLSAATGPFGTKDHGMRFEALPLDGKRTFVHVSYNYRNSAALRLAGKLYFATIGWGKVGFTVTGTDSRGNPVYIDGPRGAIERNAMRYYLAIQSYMNALRYPEEKRLGMRLSEWYDLTGRYRKQLFELDKKDYLASKTKEHMQQGMLQASMHEADK